MNPYRTPADRGEIVARRESRYDDLVLGILMLAIGGLRVGLAIGGGEPWGAEVSLAAIVTALGVFLLVFRR